MKSTRPDVHVVTPGPGTIDQALDLEHESTSHKEDRRPDHQRQELVEVGGEERPDRGHASESEKEEADQRTTRRSAGTSPDPVHHLSAPGIEAVIHCVGRC